MWAAHGDGGERDVALNDDEWAEILGSFSTKSVIRLELVSPLWLSFISDEGFRRLHTLRRHKLQPSLLLRTRTAHFFYLNPMAQHPRMKPYSFPGDLPNPKILSSCNGLMLLQCDNPQTGTKYYVYNPTTKQSRKIILDYDCLYPSIMGLSLAFDPSKLPHNIESKKSPVYYIVCVRGSWKELPGERSYQIKVYDSENPAWHLRVERYNDSRVIDFSYGVHCNNSIYWKTSDALLCFDIDKNVIRPLPPPDMTEQWRNAFQFSQLQESNGHLYLFVMNITGTSIALWELNHSQWFLKYLHDDLPPTFGNRDSTSLLRFISESDGEVETTSMLVSHVPGRIRAYNFLDKSFREELVDLTDQPFYHWNCLQFCFNDVYLFGESLAVV